MVHDPHADKPRKMCPRPLFVVKEANRDLYSSDARFAAGQSWASAIEKEKKSKTPLHLAVRSFTCFRFCLFLWLKL